MEQILRRRDVERLTGLSRSTIYSQMTQGKFPRPVRLGIRAVGWRSGDIEAWLAALPATVPSFPQRQIASQYRCHRHSRNFDSNGR